MNISPSFPLKTERLEKKCYIAVVPNKVVDKQHVCVPQNGYATQGEADKRHKCVPHKEKRTNSTNVPYKER